MFFEFPITKMLLELKEDALLPGIVFRSSRKQCDLDIEKISSSRSCMLPMGQQNGIRKEIDAVISKYGFEPDVIKKHPHFPVLLSTAVGAHHAGQLLMWRLVLEELMSRGLLRLMIATGTVAAGVDFPARTVIITAHSKRGSDGFNVLTSSEFQQMSGRAGRRGKDAVGICLVAPGPFCDARIISDVANRPPEPLRSAYFAAPSTCLNLLKYRNVDDLQFTVKKSLASFLDKKSAEVIRADVSDGKNELLSDKTAPDELTKRVQKKLNRRIKEAEILELRQNAMLDASLKGLERLGHIEGGNLTEKGYWAAELCTSLVLELAEAIDEGLFYDQPVEVLVGLVASIAGDPHRTYLAIKANPVKKEYFTQFSKVIERVKTMYEKSSEEVVVVPNAALTVLTWMESSSWPEFAGLLRLGGVAEGDAARLITQTADHLNQLTRLIKSHPELARTAEEGRKSILKPPLTETVVGD